MLEKINPFVRFSRLMTEFPAKIVVAYEHRMFLCISGTGIINIESRPFHVKKGDIVFIPAGLQYYYEADKSDPFTFIGFNFDFNNPLHDEPLPIQLAGINNFRPESVREPNFALEPFDKPFIKVSSSSIRHLFYDINREFSQKKLYYEYFCSSKMSELIFNLIRMNESISTDFSTEKTDDILLYIQNHCDENLSNSQIADIFGYHANYINRLIRQNTGMSVHRYLIECRLNRALQMLNDTDMSIGQISDAAGFPDMSSFSKTFRQHIGTSPSDYRKVF